MAGRRRQWTTLALVSVAALLERADEALLPAVYREVGAALGASPTALGTLTLLRSLVQALCYPLATCAAARYDRARVVAAGALLWAAATVLVGASATVLQMAAARAFNGVGLAIAVPAIYSLVADCSDDATRGSAFGWVQMAQTVGYIGGGCFGVLLAPTTLLGIPGWRLAFHGVALVSVSVAALVWLFAADPRPRPRVTSTTMAAAAATLLADAVREAKDVVMVPTFQVIVAEGVLASVQWSAFSFASMCLELLGFTHLMTLVISFLASFTNMLGILFAGLVGDTLARWFPRTGRIAMAQVCAALSVPLAAVVLLAFPNDPSPGPAYAAAALAYAFLMCWSSVSTNYPIFAEVVPGKARTTVYALDRCFESVLASFGSPLVGILAERFFGYQPAATPGASAEADRKNAAALAKAMFAEIAGPVTISFLAYTALYWTYPADKQRAQLAALKLGSEDLQDDDSPATEPDNARTADGLDQALLLGRKV